MFIENKVSCVLFLNPLPASQPFHLNMKVHSRSKPTWHPTTLISLPPIWFPSFLHRFHTNHIIIIIFTISTVPYTLLIHSFSLFNTHFYVILIYTITNPDLLFIIYVHTTLYCTSITITSIMFIFICSPVSAASE